MVEWKQNINNDQEQVMVSNLLRPEQGKTLCRATVEP